MRALRVGMVSLAILGLSPEHCDCSLTLGGMLLVLQQAVALQYDDEADEQADNLIVVMLQKNM